MVCPAVKVRYVKKIEALKIASATAEKQGHWMTNYWKNGPGLLLAKCSSCGLMTIVLKKRKKGWSSFGTTQKYKCTKVS